MFNLTQPSFIIAWSLVDGDVNVAKVNIHRFIRLNQVNKLICHMTINSTHIMLIMSVRFTPFQMINLLLNSFGTFFSRKLIRMNLLLSFHISHFSYFLQQWMDSKQYARDLRVATAIWYNEKIASTSKCCRWVSLCRLPFYHW